MSYVPNLELFEGIPNPSSLPIPNSLAMIIAVLLVLLFLKITSKIIKFLLVAGLVILIITQVLPLL